MTASSIKHEDRELIILIARKLTEVVDAVNHSKEVSKNLHLIATKIQNETEDTQKKIIWTAASFFVEDWKEKQNATDDEIIKLQLDCLNEAYGVIREEKK